MISFYLVNQLHANSSSISPTTVLSTAVTSTQIFACSYSSLPCASQILTDHTWDNVLGHTGLQISKSCAVIVSAGMGTFLFPQMGILIILQEISKFQHVL